MAGKDSRLEKEHIQSELASVQQFINRLKSDLEAAGFSPNRVVTDGIFKSSQILNSGIDAMADAELMPALRASKLAWIHAFFARSVLDAEMTEQYLGDQNFLELNEKKTDWRQFIEEELGMLEEEIIALRNEIKGGS